MKKIYFAFLTFLFVSSSLSAQVMWENFEDVRKGTYGFINGSFIPYTLNPDMDGNTSLVAGQYTRNAAEQFDVLILDAAMADLSDYVGGTKQMSIDVWSPAAGTTVQITLENDVLAQPANFPTGRHSVYLTTTTVAEAWETLTFTFDSQPDASVANDNVNRVVLLFAPDTNTGDTYYWDNFMGPEFAADPCDGVTPDPEVLNDFECNQNTSFTFSHSGINFRRIVNPDQNGNTSDYVASYVRNGGEENDVIIGRFDGPLALEESDRITLDIWDSNAPTDVILSLQNLSGDVIKAITKSTSESNTWQTLSFDPSEVFAATDIEQFVILFDPGNFTADQYYFDNMKFTEASTNVNELEAVESFTVAPNPTQGETIFQYELASAANVNLSIYDVTGKQITQLFNGQQSSGAHQATWLANDVANGIYFYTMTIDGKVASGKIVLNK